MIRFLGRVFQWLLAFVVALVVFVFVIIGAISALFVGAAGELSPEPVVIENDSFLVVHLGYDYRDSPGEVDPTAWQELLLAGEIPVRISLRQFQENLRAAAQDERIAGVVIEGNLFDTSLGNLALLGEMRQALLSFKASGKPIYAYSEFDSLGDYYLKSVADRMYVHRAGMLDFRGLGIEALYLGGFLEKYGIGVQVLRAGSFKTAAESLIRSDMSPEERAQLEALLADMWEHMRLEIAVSRNLATEQLGELAGRAGFFQPEAAREAGLYDEVVQADAFTAAVAEVGSYTEEGDYRGILLGDYAMEPVSFQFPPLVESTPTIAVVYADGMIIYGESEEGLVGDETLVPRLEELRRDPAVKAIVLRVNSPGGSALAADLIARSVHMAGDDKPLIVSMGGLAASGGYYMAAPADRIFVTPYTITGSIGVVSLFPNVQELAGRHGVNWQYVGTSPLANAFSFGRPLDEEAVTRLQAVVDKIYADFLGIVAEGRGMSIEQVRTVAEGRVWSGIDAVDMGLADEFGGLDAAIEHAAELAGLEEYEVRDIPPARRWEERLMEWFTGDLEGEAGEAGAVLRLWKQEAGPEAALLSLMLESRDPARSLAIAPYRLSLE